MNKRIIDALIEQMAADHGEYTITTGVAHMNNENGYRRVGLHLRDCMTQLDGDDEPLYSMTVWLSHVEGEWIDAEYDYDIHWGEADSFNARFKNEYAMAPWLMGVLDEFKRQFMPL